MKRLTFTLLATFALVACKTDKPVVTDSGGLACTDCGTTTGTTGTTSTTTTRTTPVEDCAAAGYRAATNGLQGAALWDELNALTAAQNCTSYSTATRFMFTRLHKVDDAVECVYTGRTTPVGAEKPDANDMNTEHTWPQSLGADVEPAKCDLHHLYPTDYDANQARAAYPFGVVTGSVDWQEGGSQLGDASGGGTVFEPRDVHKGNVARSMLYFSARYDMALSSSQLALFKGWHQDDPVDELELERTWSIAGEQGVANPMVVCPDLVEHL